MDISQADRERLRALAAQQAELAASQRNQALVRDWMTHAAQGAGARAMVRIEINTFEQDVLPPLQVCEGAAARDIEKRMLRPIANFTLFEDDTLVPAYYPVCEHSHFVPFGLRVKTKETGGLGHHFVPYLHELEEDYPLLGASEYGVDEEATQKEIADTEAIFGDILPVRRISNAFYCTPMQDIVHIMDMDDMYIAMVDDEELFCSMLDRLTDDYLAYFNMLAKGGHVRTAARGQHLCQGTYCFTDELTDDLTTPELNRYWLFMDAQETSGISPDMYKAIVFPYYRKLMDSFGLVSYGCCEATHPIWDNCLCRLSNLRKVSISPWCDEAAMGERLRNTNITYLRKPPATLLGVGAALDEDEVRRCFAQTARASLGCKTEIIQRDVYELHNTPDKVKRYVELIRQAMGM